MPDAPNPFLQLLDKAADQMAVEFRLTDKQKMDVKLIILNACDDILKDARRLEALIDNEWMLSCSDLGLDYEWTLCDQNGYVLGRTRFGARAAIDLGIAKFPAAVPASS